MRRVCPRLESREPGAELREREPLEPAGVLRPEALPGRELRRVRLLVLLQQGLRLELEPVQVQVLRPMLVLLRAMVPRVLRALVPHRQQALVPPLEQPVPALARQCLWLARLRLAAHSDRATANIPRGEPHPPLRRRHTQACSPILAAHSSPAGLPF